jgi:hypothetical protein
MQNGIQKSGNQVILIRQVSDNNLAIIVEKKVIQTYQQWI